MIKQSEIIGLPVLSKNGEKVGLVREVIYSKKRFRVLGLLISDKSIFKDAEIIKFCSIKSIGKDAVFVEDCKVVEKSSSDIEISSIIMSDNKSIIEEEVLTEDGESLGHIKDILLDENKGKIMGFILTDGFIDDIKDGRNVLPNDLGITFGEDVLIVNDELKDKFYKYKNEYKKLLELL
ncbi:PRC-barrel domain-containing protein [Gottschalkia purinilytica]|uniref:PRC-barrel domain-containing protein n=1 Tax=Gottschalkia purinilytica TaxID=1503 RepID=A0A0L0WEI3_GOTPU|nr:PRC-barrel domain-containing protein [Gottschalkia purinilytica]KNF09888.1 PRC-barrel domain-containing protein [Gottschalkia purinilytica]